MIQISLGDNNAATTNPSSTVNLEASMSKVPKYNLTNEGFHFVLQDTPTQVHKVLQKYILFIQNKYKDEAMVVMVIKLIFNLALSEFNRSYKLRGSESGQGDKIQSMTWDFEQMGLVEFSKVEKGKFYITKLMQSFLLTQIGNSSNQSAEMRSLALADGAQDANKPNSNSERFIIVETSFRVYAYTTSKLYKEVLKLFLEPKIEFPDMLYGVLTKKTVERAFR